MKYVADVALGQRLGGWNCLGEPSPAFQHFVSTCDSKFPNLQSQLFDSALISHMDWELNSVTLKKNIVVHYRESANIDRSKFRVPAKSLCFA